MPRGPEHHDDLSLSFAIRPRLGPSALQFMLRKLLCFRSSVLARRKPNIGDRETWSSDSKTQGRLQTHCAALWPKPSRSIKTATRFHEKPLGPRSNCSKRNDKKSQRGHRWQVPEWSLGRIVASQLHICAVLIESALRHVLVQQGGPEAVRCASICHPCVA